MTEIKTPHNNFFEAMLSNREIVTDFLKTHLPKDIQVRLDFNSIRPEKNTFMSDELKKSETDVLFSVNLDGKPSYIYCLIEHQSTPDKTMPIRLHKYLLNAMEWHINMKKGENIPVIIPLVIYNSRIPWNYPTGVVSMFDKDQQELAKNILINDFKLVNLHDIDDSQIMQHNWASLLELSLKWARERDIIEILEKVKPFLIMACRDNKKVFFATLNYLIDVGETDKNKLIEWSKQNLKDDEEVIMTVAEQWIEQGVKKTALKMINDPNHEYTDEQMQYLTGLSSKQIDELKAENQEDFEENN